MKLSPRVPYVSVYCSSSLWRILLLVSVFLHFHSTVHCDIKTRQNHSSLLPSVNPCFSPATAFIKKYSFHLQNFSPLVLSKPAQIYDSSPPPLLQCLQTVRWNPPPSPLPPQARTTSPARPTLPKITPRTPPSPCPSQKSAKLLSTTFSTFIAASLPSRR